MKELILPALAILVAGLTVLSSISRELFLLQLLWAVLGFSFVILFWFFDWRTFLNYRWLVIGCYLLSIALLILAYAAGPVIRNTRSWIVIGPIQFQPVEFAKVALILLFAQYFSRRHFAIARWKHILTSFFYFILPATLVALQPDLGSVSVLFGIWFGFLLISGLPLQRIFIVSLVFVLAAVLMWQFVLRDYQRARIIAVFYPEWDVQGINYSLTQSKIAIGSAGFWGKGYGQGSQTQLGFLTEPASDFIFSALIEEWGWIGGALVIFLITFLLRNILKTGLVADQNFEKFICIGTVITFAWQFFINVGSATGILPVVGVTFPFLSYGGSSLITNFFLLAIVNAIAVKS